MNSRIREISDRWGTADRVYRLVCECGVADCEERVDVPVGRYDELRQGSEFLVAPAHDEPLEQPEPHAPPRPSFTPATSLPSQ